MKSILIIFSIFLGFSASAQDVSQIFKAIGDGDVNSISKVLQSEVELCFDTNQDFFSKADAVKELRKFFGKVKPSTCKHLHDGNSKDNSSGYSVGEMKTDQGTYRVFVYIEGKSVVGLSFYPA